MIAAAASDFFNASVWSDSKHERVISPCYEVNRSTRLLRFLREEHAQVPGGDQTLMWFYRPEQSRLLGAHCKGQHQYLCCVMVHTTDYIIHQQAKAERRARDCDSASMFALKCLCLPLMRRRWGC